MQAQNQLANQARERMQQRIAQIKQKLQQQAWTPTENCQAPTVATPPPPKCSSPVVLLEVPPAAPVTSARILKEVKENKQGDESKKNQQFLGF